MDDRGAVDKTAGIVAVVAGLVAAVKLARVELGRFRAVVSNGYRSTLRGPPPTIHR
jgi:hypothetical protein